MDVLKDCSEDERRVFNEIANGKSVEDFPPEIIQSLLKKELLNDDAGFITIPAIVWNMWKNNNS